MHADDFDVSRESHLKLARYKPASIYKDLGELLDQFEERDIFQARDAAARHVRGLHLSQDKARHDG